MDVEAMVLSAANRIRDPITGRSLAAASIVRNARLEGEILCYEMVVSGAHDDATRRRLREQLERQCRAGGWEGEMRGTIREKDASPTPAQAAAPEALPKAERIEGVRHIIAVASGKGGVGKSTVSVHLALGLAGLGLRVGLLDADVYGPSLPLLMGVNERPTLGEGERILPVEAHGIRCMSMGFLLGEGTPVIWRGPMVMGVVRQFLTQVQWAPLDVLVIDLPPGTGDAQLTLVQTVPLSGAIIVTTPQEIALADAERGLAMFRQLGVPILGLVENMAWYELPGGHRDHPFGSGGAERLGIRHGVEVLVGLPLDGRIRAGGDAGDPTGLEGPARELFAELAAKVARRVEPPLVRA
jgi:ATP-binding protein involved in chromosome partitioning